MESFEELKELVLHYVRGIWRNRWIAIAIAWPVLIAGLIVVDQMKDRYEADTKVFIDTTSVLKPLLKGLAVESDIESNVRLMAKKMLSRPNLERAIRMMDMDINVESRLDMDKLIERIKERVKISTLKKTGIYTISYEDTNPQRAKRMVQTLLDIFVEDTLGNSAKDSDSAISFLDKQIAKYEKLLQEAEQRVEVFKRENVGIMPKDGENYYKKLQAITSQYEEAKLELNETVQRRDKLRSQLDELTIEKTVEATSSQYDERIKKLESELDDLLLSYTDAHPDVINKRRIIASLKKKREAEIKDVKLGATSSKLDNPVYQQLQVLLSEAEANISSLSARTAAYKKKMAELKQLVNVVPKVEAEMQRLNRDYEVHKKNYNELVTRREQAKISEDVDTGSKQVKFRIIEPPRVPTKPSFPNRPLFDAAVLVLALGIGYGLGLLLSMAKPVFYNTKDLREFTGLPVLGSVMKFDTHKVLVKRKRNVYLFLIANISLILVTGVAIYLHSQHIFILSSLQLKLMSFT